LVLAAGYLDVFLLSHFHSGFVEEAEEGLVTPGPSLSP
jgi:hypothetical protein